MFQVMICWHRSSYHLLLTTVTMHRLSSLLVLVILSVLVIAAMADFPHNKPKNHPVLP